MTCFRARIRYLTAIIISLCIGATGGFLLSEYRNRICDASSEAVRFSEAVRESVLQAGVQIRCGEKSGTGIIWKSEADGSILLLTCAHLVEEGETIFVQTVAEKGWENAAPVGLHDQFDVAVLRIASPKADYGEGIRARLSAVAYGEEVIACTNPGGDGLMLTCGIIGYPYESKECNDFVSDYHRTDILLSPGASGGGLYDSDGALLGMVCFREDMTVSPEEETRGRGYAIPSDTLLHVADFILENRSKTNDFSVRFSAQEASLSEAKLTKEPLVIKSKIASRFPSLLTGDKVISASINGINIPVNHTHYLNDAVQLLTEGDVLILTIDRFEEKMCLTFYF